MSNLLISPHNDDETLFAAFTLCREAADIQVVVIFDGYVQAARGEPVTWQQRREETVAALKELGVVKPPVFAGFRDDTPEWGWVEDYLRKLKNEYNPVKVYAPTRNRETHNHHWQIGDITKLMWNYSVTYYTTYTPDGKEGEQYINAKVTPEADWICRKLRALACYRSQIRVENCREHFMRGLHEYYA